MIREFDELAPAIPPRMIDRHPPVSHPRYNHYGHEHYLSVMQSGRRQNIWPARPGASISMLAIAAVQLGARSSCSTRTVATYQKAVATESSSISFRPRDAADFGLTARSASSFCDAPAA